MRPMIFARAVHHEGRRIAAGQPVPDVSPERIAEWIGLGCIDAPPARTEADDLADAIAAALSVRVFLSGASDEARAAFDAALAPAPTEPAPEPEPKSRKPKG